ncbi:reverse transcriptase domain-containing protein [Tanacetum coccineum]
MADNRTMEELLQAPTEGYGEAIVIPEINADHFEIKTNLLQLVQANPFHDTFYNGLNDNDQDSLNTAAGGNLLSKTTREALNIIENKSKVHYSQNKSNVSRVNTNSRESSRKTDERIDKLIDQISTLVEIVSKKVVSPAMVKVVEESCVICGDAHAYYNCPTTNSNQSSVCAAMGTYNQVAPPNRVSNQMAPPGFAPMQNSQNSKQEENLRKNLNNDMRSILGSFFQNQASTSGTLPSNTIPNPKGEMKAITTRSGATLAGPSVPPPSPTKEVDREPETKTDQVLTESTNNVPPPVVQPSPDSTNLPPAPISTPKIPEPNPHQPPIPYPSSFSKALAHMPKFEKMVKDLLTNKEKLLEIENTPVNENCSAVILKKLPEKLEDTGRFLIPCEFYGLESCMALADLGASINLMPLSVWKTLSLLELSTTRMTLELATRTIFVPEGIAEDHPQEFSDKSIHKIDILDTTCNDHFHEMLDNHISGNPTFSPEPTVESLSPSLTSFGDSDFLLEETDAFLSLDDSIPPGIDDDTYNSEGDILFLESLLNDNPSPNLPPTPHPDLPSHLEYVFLEGTSKLPVIIAKDLKKEEKEQLLKVLKSHKQAIAWKISNIRGINPNFCTHKILMEDDFKLVVQQQRRVNPKIHEVIKAEVIKLLDAGLIYPISDSSWFLKKRLTEAPILVSPDWDLPFELMCDASDYAVGAVLGQRKDKYFRPIHYASKTISDAQTNYTVTEKELLAVVYAFEKFRYSTCVRRAEAWIFSKLAIMGPTRGTTMA